MCWKRSIRATCTIGIDTASFRQVAQPLCEEPPDAPTRKGIFVDKLYCKPDASRERDADFSRLPLSSLILGQEFACGCGRAHRLHVRCALVAAGALRELPRVLAESGISRPFVVCDANTREAAWAQTQAELEAAGIPYTLFVFPYPRVEPDEHAVGAMAMAFDPACDGILAVGSGVINDCCKVLAKATGRPQAVVATAPSMDGYASDSASMIQNRVKVTIPTPSPVAIIADTDITRHAPMRMLQAGLGDMLAKYIALFEWRVSHLVVGEWYCERVAELMRVSVRKCVENAGKLMERDARAVESVMEGLILSGIAMGFAQCSRPASGLEHYFSHMWEMMALERGQESDLHGIQAGVGVNLTLRILDRLLAATPDMDAAERHLAGFDPGAWAEEMRAIFGAAAESIITGETERYHKNDPACVRRRLCAIERHWEDIRQAARQELPEAGSILALMRGLRMPAWPADLGVDAKDTRDALIGSRDIRDKYLTSSLLWDLGLLHGYAAALRSDG